MEQTIQMRATELSKNLLLSDLVANPLIQDVVALLQQIQEVTLPSTAPATCDGKEQHAFEDWARRTNYCMDQHPMFYLFMDSKTNAARQGWRAGLDYCFGVENMANVASTLYRDNAECSDQNLIATCSPEAIKYAKQFSMTFPELRDKEAVLCGWFTNTFTDMLDSVREKEKLVFSKADKWDAINRFIQELR